MLPLILLKGKRLILIRILTVPSQTTFVNQKTTFLHRRRIDPRLLPLPPPGWVNYSKIKVQQKRDIMGHIIFWTAKMNSTIPLEYNLRCTIHFKSVRNFTMHGEVWNNFSMLVNWMFIFLYVGWTTLGLIPMAPRSTSRRCETRYLSCVRYGSMGKAGYSRKPLKICIKNILIIQRVSQTMRPVGPFRYPLHTYLHSRIHCVIV